MGFINIIYLLSIILSINGLRPRIYGGRDAPEGKYPYQVSLRTANRHFCGGSIISKRWILTAAHCLTGKNATNIKVAVGTLSRSPGSGTSYQAKLLVYHKNYTLESLHNDIGLIRVKTDIQFNDKVKPIIIASNKTTAVVNETVVVTGWGLVGENTRLDRLQYISPKIYDLKKCKPLMKHEVIASHICTITRKGEGFCAGDSGGPLVNKRGVQIGIVSYAKGCALGYPDIYTRVSSFTNWIIQEITRHSPQTKN